MDDWISWTKCTTCGHVEKDLFQQSDGMPPPSTPVDVRCPRCGGPARLTTFPAFEIETIDTSLPDRFSYETMEDW